MPIYEFECGTCGKRLEEYRPISEYGAPGPECCGAPSGRIMSPCGMAFLTKGGNWTNVTAAAGLVQKGNRRPKTIGRGHGLGGRRPNPSIRHVEGNTFAVESKAKP